MAKKKKSQLKPVARGFATTSIAKKVVQLEAEEELAGEAFADTVEEKTQKEKNEEKAGGPSPVQDEADESNPEKVEMQSLQNLVDKLQERIEKEVSRTLKVGFVYIFLYYLFHARSSEH
jgi:ATP-dependent RNA helicase DHX29